MVVEYDPCWPELFAELRRSIWTAVVDIALSLEQVGSTSVPGLAAKSVIDIDVVVPSAQIARAIARKSAMCTAGISACRSARLLCALRARRRTIFICVQRQAPRWRITWPSVTICEKTALPHVATAA